MHDFYVDLSALPGLGDQLRRHGEYALAGRSYVQDRTALHGVEGWLNKLGDAHESVVDTTMRWLRQVENPLAVMSAETVDRTVDGYRGTDGEAAARLDAQLPSNRSLLTIPEPEGEDALNLGHSWLGVFDDALDPEEHYRSIPDYNQDERYQHRPEWYDLSGAGGIARRVVWEATSMMADLGWIDRPFDLYEWALKWVVGDWAGFRGCADVFRNLADAVDAMGGNFHRTQITLPEAWQGNAADSCNVHLGRIRRAFKDAEDPLRAIADHYEEAADGQARFRMVVAFAIDQLVDLAFKFLLAVAGLAPAIAVILASYVVKIIRGFLIAWEAADAVMAGVDGGLRHFGQMQAPGYTLPKLPEISGLNSTLDDLPSERRT